MTDNEMIYKALQEYEKNHYESEDDKWQEQVNKLINGYFKKKETPKVNPVIAMGYISHEKYEVYEDEEGHHAGKLVDSYTNDDPYYEVMDGYDGENLETFDSYEEAKIFVSNIEHHDALDVDYDDEKKMFSLVKYNGYHNEWNDTGIYSDNAEKLREIIRITEGK